MTKMEADRISQLDLKIADGYNRNLCSTSTQIIHGASYGIHTAQALDIYLPPNRSASSTKILVIIHGGGFNAGGKDELSAYIRPMQARLAEYAFFNITYRQATTNDTLFPAQENDVKVALEFIINNSANFNVSKKVVLLGVSAGGTLALLQGYKYNEPVIPKAIVSFFGPTDLMDLYKHSWNPLVPFTLRQVTGKTPIEDPSIYTSSSPINFVSADSPPTILFQGGLDPLVNKKQQSMLQDRLTDAGVCNQYVFYPNEGHGWQGRTLANSFRIIETFLNENVH
jgi:acetyl esterase/lipase